MNKEGRVFLNPYIAQVLEQRRLQEENLAFDKVKELDWLELKQLGKEIAFDIFYKKMFEKICILYDPDVDGIYSGYILEDFLVRANFDKNNLFRFMNENKVHGFSNSLVEFCKEKEIDLLFVVDAGSSDVLKFHEALPNTRVVVLDHHEYENHELPEDNKISRLNVCDYSHLPALSGCGVVFRFIESMNRFLDVYIDMYETYVGITVLSDSCRMDVPENRYYVSKAYQNNDSTVFLKTFKDIGFYGSNLSLYSFKIIPYLNALIRIGQGDTAMKIVNNMDSLKLKTFIPENEKKVKEYQAQEVEKIRNMSQVVEGDGFTILLRKSKDELKTLNGLVANKIMSEYKKSAFVLRLDEEEHIWKGSFRGLDFSNNILGAFGFDCRGHGKACGASITPENLRNFVKNFEYIPEDTKQYDLEMSLEEIMHPNNAKAFAEFNEFAGGNISPIKIKVTDSLKTKNTSKLPRGFSGKFFIISLNGYEITDFTPTPISQIDDLIVTLNFSKYNPYQLVRVV